MVWHGMDWLGVDCRIGSDWFDVECLQGMAWHGKSYGVARCGSVG